ncbi:MULTISPECIES: radical SAM protein [unclassified Fibrobacter]|uniref:7-carboxy-7-deazaguanine synthase QueE n=1 Tax=unclassified Fibrobacter TaxID=2634177 RepID=UPI000D6C71F7|nr:MULTISPECIES: radical SAM protein [unclassified Fibrobacter]PWJ63371.1 7-carboxy-7-deazaguanine synthase [Fibrobacter sp. UWR4]PZW68306.1 7-carboxy-7-deazaguanine synthase [Fibrobacter sp. UWR1]
MKISEIFLSIEGEGIRTGAPAVFIRLFGCNLRCKYCDSMYAVEGDDFQNMTPQEVLEKVKSFNTQFVTLTGGEPLIHKDVKVLLKILDDSGYEINIETNGTQPKPKGIRKLICTMDWKSISSGMQPKMKLENMMTLRGKDVLKFVVGSDEDLQDAARVIGAMEAEYARDGLKLPTFYVSPIFGTMKYEDMVNWILHNATMKRNNVRFQVQLHKIIWNPDARGV